MPDVPAIYSRIQTVKEMEKPLLPISKSINKEQSSVVKQKNFFITHSHLKLNAGR